ncbi:MAG TPA: peptide chain release factor N(5)-glutamine methyltransferase [Vicinamibacterales bacterium]|nr:peptide chain release factor N(5)-glutamine methyltransferase [Vicinamibacterales bacterium]
MTLLQSAADAARQLASAGLSADDSRRDAVLLARWRLGWTAATWLTRSNERVPAGFSEAFEPLIARRARREPLAYITGEREFYGRAFRVTPDVLIPRPETELLVEQALEQLKEMAGTSRPDGEPARAVDVGTGSGCLAITLALEAPASRIVATDVSPAALDVARSNARDLGVPDRIEFRIASLADDFPAAFDLIVANPPYVPEADRASLSPEVREYEPAGALFAGPDGLDVIRALVPSAAAALRPHGVLMMEIGDGQADAVVHLMRMAGFSQIRLVADLQSIPRVIMGTGCHVSVLPNHQG